MRSTVYMCLIFCSCVIETTLLFEGWQIASLGCQLIETIIDTIIEFGHRKIS